ncbi:MAG TPA: extracellular solute-binding protein [Chloroflexota bacterium]|nr:extracellular solute-binding protein [Chloroflexota bacterium]
MRASSFLAKLAVAGVVIASLGVAAGTRTVAPTQAAGSVSLATWSSNPTEQAGQKKLVDSFQNKYGTTIDFQVINGDYPTVLKARFTAGTAPDVFYINSDYFQDFASSGALMNLDFLKNVKSFGYDQYYKNLQVGYIYNKHIYGLVKDYSTLALEYNKTMFKKAGIKAPPKTWAELQKDACKLTNRANKVYGISLSADPARWAAFLIQAGGGSTGGGGILNKAQTKAYIKSAAGLAALKFYAGLVQKGCAARPDQVGAGWNGEAFGRQNVAMAIEGNWITSYLQQTFPSLNWGVAPLPVDKKAGNLAFTAAYGVYARTSNKSNAIKLLEYLAGKSGTTVWSHVVGYLPARKDVKPPAGTKVFADQTKYAKDWFFPPGFTNRALTPIGNDIQAVMDGKMSASSALNDMQNKATQALQNVP